MSSFPAVLNNIYGGEKILFFLKEISRLKWIAAELGGIGFSLPSTFTPMNPKDENLAEKFSQNRLLYAGILNLKF